MTKPAYCTESELTPKKQVLENQTETDRKYRKLLPSNPPEFIRYEEQHMKTKILALLVMLALAGCSSQDNNRTGSVSHAEEDSNHQAIENYRLTINGTDYDLGLDAQKTITLADGEKLAVCLAQKEIITFQSTLCSFSHNSGYTPAKTELGDGIYQTMLMSPLGTGIMIQEYTKLDPSRLVNIMLQELTKEEVQYGYAYEEREATKQLVDGVILHGKEATTSYGDEKWHRAVYAYGAGDHGVLLVTMIEQENVTTEQHILDTFWKSLRLHVK